MILAEARRVLTPENRAAAWRKHDTKLMAQTNVVAVIRGPTKLISTASDQDPTSASIGPSNPSVPIAYPSVPPLPAVLPGDLPGAIKRLDDQELDRLVSAVLAEQQRRGRKPPMSDEVARKPTVGSLAVSLAPGKLNAVRAALRRVSSHRGSLDSSGSPKLTFERRWRVIGELARISHRKRRIGAPNQRKLLCRNDITQIRGTPRCRQSVTRNHLILEPWKVAVWKRHSMAGWSPPTREHCCWERPIERSE